MISLISLKTSGVPRYNLLTYINCISSVIFLAINSGQVYITFGSVLIQITSKNVPQFFPRVLKSLSRKHSSRSQFSIEKNLKSSIDLNNTLILSKISLKIFLEFSLSKSLSQIQSLLGACPSPQTLFSHSMLSYMLVKFLSLILLISLESSSTLLAQ